MHDQKRKRAEERAGITKFMLHALCYAKRKRTRFKPQRFLLAKLKVSGKKDKRLHWKFWKSVYVDFWSINDDLDLALTSATLCRRIKETNTIFLLHLFLPSEHSSQNISNFAPMQKRSTGT